MDFIFVRIPPLPRPGRLTLPGGVSIEHLRLAEVVQPALTPLMPAFDIINAVLATFECVKAIPETFGPPPDPTALVEAISNLTEKVSRLMALIPQMSLPLTVVGLLDLLLGTLVEAHAALLELQGRSAAADEALIRAAELEDELLARIAALVSANLEQEAANLAGRLGAMGGLIGLLNLFTSMIGAPEVPDLSEVGGKPLDEALAALEALVETLRSIRSAIPIP